MQKKIIALAIASALTVPALALAADNGNVTVYGVADVSFDRTDNSGATGVKVNHVSSNTSRLGFKGSEDLGDGLKAIWQIETTIKIDNNGGAGLADRPTFAGLAGANWGSVTMGRHESSYKTSTRAMDMFYDHIADNRTLMGVGSAGVGSFDSRNSNSIRYDSPDFSGFKVSGLYAFNSETNTTSAADYKAKTISLSGVYSAGGITGVLAYQKNDIGNNTAPTVSDEKAWKAGGGYAMDQFAVNAIYEKTTDNLGSAAGGMGHKAYYVAGKFNATANDAIKLAYTKSKNERDGSASDTGAKQWALGVDHNLSKRTTVYAMYTKLDNDASQNATFTTLGNGDGVSGVGTGNDPSAFSFGMKHVF